MKSWKGKKKKRKRQRRSQKKTFDDDDGDEASSSLLVSSSAPSLRPRFDLCGRQECSLFFSFFFFLLSLSFFLFLRSFRYAVLSLIATARAMLRRTHPMRVKPPSEVVQVAAMSTRGTPHPRMLQPKRKRQNVIG